MEPLRYFLAEHIPTTISADGIDGDNGRSAIGTTSRRRNAVPVCGWIRSRWKAGGCRLAIPQRAP